LEFHYLVFEGKQDLEKQLVRKLRGWAKPESAFVVLRDQDAADCTAVKNQLVKIATESSRRHVLVRVACRELEASNKEAFRDPDRLVRPVEALRSFLPDYQKRDGARRVGILLEPERSRSRSFRVFCAGVRRLAGRE